MVSEKTGWYNTVLILRVGQEIGDDGLTLRHEFFR